MLTYKNLPLILNSINLSFDEAGTLCGVSGATLSKLANGRVKKIKNAAKREAVETFIESMHARALKETAERLKELKAMRN